METTQQLTLQMPLWAWAAVAVLMLGWIYVMLPDRFKPSAKSKTPRYQQLERLGGESSIQTQVNPVYVPSRPKWTVEVLASLNAGQLTSLVTGFWQARVCTVEPAGNDLLIFRPSTGRLFAIAHCATGKAGLDQIQSLWEFVQQRAAPLGLFYGVSGFTPEALAFAKDKHLKLLTGADLIAEIGHLRPEQQQALLERAASQPLAAAA